MIQRTKRFCFLVVILIITFCCVSVKAYYQFEKDASTTFTTAGYTNLNLTTNKDTYGFCNNTTTISLTVTNLNAYNVIYTISFRNENLTYMIDNSLGSSYNVLAGSSKTHTIVVSGSTGSSELYITVTSSMPYSEASITKTVALDLTCPSCNFKNLANNYLKNTATITYDLECTDQSGITNTSLSANDFTLTNESLLDIINITTSNITNGYRYTLTLMGKAGNGSNTITLKPNVVSDENGNNSPGVASANIITDNTTPTINISNAKDGIWTNSNVSVTVSFSDNNEIDASSLAYGTDGSTWTSIINSNQNSFSDVWTSEMSGNGHYKICDKAGNCSSTSTNIKIDKTLPICSFGSWSLSSIETDETATINLTCTDGLSGIETTNLTASAFSLSNSDSLEISGVTSNGTSAQREFTITVTGLDVNGSSTITLLANKVSDIAGNSNTAVTSSSSIEVVADSLPPTIEFNPSTNTTPAKTHSTTVTLTDQSPIAEARYLWAQSDSASAESGTSFTSGASISKSSGNGNWYLCVYARDQYNNEINECSGVFIFDNTAPTIFTTTPVYVGLGESNTIASLAVISDNYDATPTVVMNVDNTVMTNTQSLTSGSYTLTIIATDDAGNSATKETELIVYFYLQNKCSTVTTTDSFNGLFKDQTDSTRCIYRGGTGSTVNNYFRFGDDASYEWRIVGVEADGTIKIIKETSLGTTRWNNGNDIVALNSAAIMTELNTYYNGLSDHKKSFITPHTFYTGSIYVTTADAYPTIYLANSSQNSEVNKERTASANLNIGFINASDFHKAYRTASGNGCVATNFIKDCEGTLASNWLYPTSSHPTYFVANNRSTTYAVSISNAVNDYGGLVHTNKTTSSHKRPAVFLDSRTAVYGSGTPEDPYVPVLPIASDKTCTITTTEGYDPSKLLTINVSNAEGVTYSWDGVNYSSTNTQTISAAGTHVAYIKDSYGLKNSCSINIVSRTEYQVASCTPSYGSWQQGALTCYTLNEALSLNQYTMSWANYGGHLYYYSCGAGGYGVCAETDGHSCYKYTRTCTRTNCGSFGEWTTNQASSACNRLVNTRITYGPSE